MASLILASSQILASPVLTQVLQSSFSPSALHETFSEPIDYSNATNHPYEDKSGSMVVIGNNNSYIFSNTGVTFASPIPNLYGNWLPIISAVKANQDFSFAYYGELMPNSGLIPGGAGAKFLLEAGSSSNHFAPFRLTFPGNGATRIGFNPIMSGQTPGTDRIVITAYGVTNNLLGILYAPVCNVTAWAGNFFGLAMSDGTAIQSIGIDYSTNNNAGNPGIANLMFDPYISTTKIWACGGSTGSWNQTENWTHGKPQNPGEIAIFSSATNSPATVTLDASQKAGQLVFDNSGAGYTIASGTSGNLTLWLLVRHCLPVPTPQYC
ncbi:MAG: hypothetical protein NTV36_02005 [Candidatus Staskawiczbacteria bacterium]|nr:hypothetical protein [Candidatus Staskawiczbacteria bacterium]